MMEPKKALYIVNLLQSCIDKRSHLTGKHIHAHIIRTTLFTDTFLSNRLIELYSKCKNTHYARNLFDKIPHKNIYSWNAMLCMYCNVANLETAYSLFDEMPERNVVSCNNLISALARCGYESKALDVYDRMVLEGFAPTRFTFASVLSACGVLFDLECGRKCHCVAVKIGLEMNKFVSNALLSVYAKCGIVRDAFRVFESIQEPNEVSFTAMMGGLAQSKRAVEAFEMFRLMCRKRICIDSVSLSTVLGVCGSGSSEVLGSDDYSDDFSGGDLHGKQVHGIAIKLGLESELHLSNSLLDMYTKNGDMDSAEQVFNNIREVSVVSWNVMIAGYGQKYQNKKAIECFQRMTSSGLEPDEVSYINMLGACVKSGDMETGREMFDSIKCPSISSWNAVLSGYFQMGSHEQVLTLFREMQFGKDLFDRTTLVIFLGSCAAMGLLDSGKQVHAASLKAAFHDDLYVGSGLISVYSKCRRLEKALCIFQNMLELDIACWNSMLSGFSLNSLDKEAFTFFKQMLQNGISPTQFSYATILSSCAKLSSLFQGRQIHAQITKEGFLSDIFVGSALIGMYCKCGDVVDARKLFDNVSSKNTVTWNEMIHGYAQNGYGDEAVNLYRDMIGSGERPDGITFVAVLTACSHAGLVDTGIKIFESMQQEYGLVPDLEHYTCIIDALGRAGRFDEAEALVDKLPFKDDPIVWEVLLSSCRLHANVCLAKRAAEELFRLDPQNSVPYVLLANIYTSLGRWDDVKEIRELMANKKVVKNPGYSWIEDGKVMQTFTPDNTNGGLQIAI